MNYVCSCNYKYIVSLLDYDNSATASAAASAFSQEDEEPKYRGIKGKSNRETGDPKHPFYISIVMRPRRSSLRDYELLSLQQEKADAGNDDV